MISIQYKYCIFVRYNFCYFCNHLIVTWNKTCRNYTGYCVLCITMITFAMVKNNLHKWKRLQIYIVHYGTSYLQNLQHSKKIKTFCVSQLKKTHLYLVHCDFSRTLDPIDTFNVSVNPYDHILSMVPGDYGVWVTLRGSSILELWDPKNLNCKLLYDTRTDRYPQLRKASIKEIKMWPSNLCYNFK